MIAGLLTSVAKSRVGKKPKKVDKQKLLPAAKGDKEQKALPGTAKGSSIIVRPKTSIVSKIKVTKYRPSSGDDGGGRGGALTYDGLSNRLDALVKNTNTLSQIAKTQYSNEVERDKSAKIDAQRSAQKIREEKAELQKDRKSEKKSYSLGLPKFNIFDGIFGTLQKLAFGTAVMQLLNWFSDPKKSSAIFKFLEDNFVAMFIGTMAVMGTIAGFSLLSMGGMLTLGLPLFFKLAGLFTSVLLSPLGLAALGAAGLIMLFATPTAEYDGITGENAVWKDPRLNPAQRKTMIESVFGHLTPDKWDPEALKLYKETLQGLKLDFNESIKALEPQRARAQAIIEQQRREGFLDPKPQATAVPGQASKTLAAAAASMKGFSSAAGPDGGRNGCVWAVNKVFDKAGLKTPWGSSNWVPDAEEAMVKDGYQYIKPGEQQPGDLYIAPGQKHVGIVLENGNIISNSSSSAAFSWEDSPEAYANYYGGPGKYYRMPAQLKPSQAASPSVIDEAAAVSRSASYESTDQQPVVPVVQPSPLPSNPSSGGGTAISFGANPQTQLNNYYRNQVLGNLYRQ